MENMQTNCFYYFSTGRYFCLNANSKYFYNVLFNYGFFATKLIQVLSNGIILHHNYSLWDIMFREELCNTWIYVSYDSDGKRALLIHVYLDEITGDTI